MSERQPSIPAYYGGGNQKKLFKRKFYKSTSTFLTAPMRDSSTMITYQGLISLFKQSSLEIKNFSPASTSTVGRPWTMVREGREGLGAQIAKVKCGDVPSPMLIVTTGPYGHPRSYPYRQVGSSRGVLSDGMS
jgi:hypothetical protein